MTECRGQRNVRTVVQVLRVGELGQRLQRALRVKDQEACGKGKLCACFERMVHAAQPVLDPTACLTMTTPYLCHVIDIDAGGCGAPELQPDESGELSQSAPEGWQRGSPGVGLPGSES